MLVKTMSLGVNGTNCYFIIDEKTKETVIIDPADDAERIISFAEKNGLNVRRILLTHGHYDHIQALDRIREHFNLPASIHKEDEEMLYDASKSHQLQYSGDTTPYKKVESVLIDGEIIPIGSSQLSVMHTPGHSKGSCCFLGDDFIISGDTLFAGSMGRYDLYGGDFGMLRDSLKRIKALDGDLTVYPGHGPESSLDVERMYNPYLSVF